MSKHTPGPWKVFEKRYPHYLHGEHVELCIGTEWYHPQMKGPLPIVTASVGIGETEGSAPVHMVSIGPEDARLIAAAPELFEALDSLQTAFMSHTNWSGYPPAEIVAARAALAKARGEA